MLYLQTLIISIISFFFIHVFSILWFQCILLSWRLINWFRKLLFRESYAVMVTYFIAILVEFVRSCWNLLIIDQITTITVFILTILSAIHLLFIVIYPHFWIICFFETAIVQHKASKNIPCDNQKSYKNTCNYRITCRFILIRAILRILLLIWLYCIVRNRKY